MSKRNTANLELHHKYRLECKLLFGMILSKKDCLSKTYNEDAKICGDPKIREKLEGKNYKRTSSKRVQRHMKKLGIRFIAIKKHRANFTKKYMRKAKIF